MDNTSLFIEGVDYEKHLVMIGNSSGEIYITLNETKTNGIVWSNDENVLFYISAPLCENELIKMAENLIEKNN